MQKECYADKLKMIKMYLPFSPTTTDWANEVQASWQDCAVYAGGWLPVTTCNHHDSICTVTDKFRNNKEVSFLYSIFFKCYDFSFALSLIDLQMSNRMQILGSQYGLPFSMYFALQW